MWLEKYKYKTSCHKVSFFLWLFWKYVICCYQFYKIFAKTIYLSIYLSICMYIHMYVYIIYNIWYIYIYKHINPTALDGALSTVSELWVALAISAPRMGKWLCWNCGFLMYFLQNHFPLFGWISGIKNSSHSLFR